MANPIVDNLEFLMEQEHQQEQLKRLDGQQQQQDTLDNGTTLLGLPFSFQSFRQSSNQSLHDNQSTHSSESEMDEEESTYLAKRWQSLMRRMSVTIQRENGTPDRDIVSGTLQQPTEHEKQLMLTIPMPPAQDDHLPSIEEVVQETAVVVPLTELKPSYFEHPFESESEPETKIATLVHPLAPSAESHRSRPFMPRWSSSYDSKVSPDHTPPSPSTSHHLMADSSPQPITLDSADSKEKVTRSSMAHHHRRSSVAPITWSIHPLVPYYPPLFVVPHYAMFSRDEHGRRPPPILFDVLHVSILDSEIDHNAMRLWTVRIGLHYGDIKWTVRRSIIEFYNLHLTLKFKAAGLGSHTEAPPSFPSQLAHLCNAALTSMRITRPADEEDELWSHVTTKRRNALEQYLKDVILNYRLGTNYDLCEFLELSAISITKDMGWKGKEGYLEHKVKPTSFKISNAHRWMNRWAKKWVLVRDSYIAFCKDVSASYPSEVILFDRHFKIERSHGTFSPYHHTHMIITNSTRRIEIKGPTNRHIDDWEECFDTVMKKSPWIGNHRYMSFAPVRQNAKVKWFVDGHEYFEAVAEALLSAKSEIYIEDWWLSPELYLRRPPKGNEEYRLDRLLKRKAMEGVKIYIVIYKNMSVALPLDSQHTRDWLQNIHKNIKVLRHADQLSAPLWAHHEKILVIDNRLAFIGGLDLCFGRYDTYAHPLTDHTSSSDQSEIFPGQDYSNPRIKDFHNVSQYNMETINKKVDPRMPWHDIHMAMVGQPARDIARHFIQRWNFIKAKAAKVREDLPLLLPKGEYVSPQDELKFKGTCRAQIIRSSAEWSLGISREYSIYNAYMECITKAKHFIYIENQFFITATSSSDKLIQNKIGQAIVARIRRAYLEQKKFKVIVLMPLAPSFEGDFAIPTRKAMPLRSVAHYQYQSISRGGRSILETLQQENIPAEEYIEFYSLRNWGKVKKPTGSNLNSPNASGILSDPSSPSSVNGTDVSRNNSLDGRVMNGYRSKLKKTSKIRNSVGSLATIRTGYNSGLDESTSSGQKQRSRSNSEDWEKENWKDGRMDFVTEEIYIHSKLMIVDDRIVVCGSANLNDRSQLGNRDSEIAVVVEDTDIVTSRMDGKEYQAGRFALTLRLHLFKEHLGLLHGHLTEREADEVVMDPLDDEFLENVWNKTAKGNTRIYRRVFHCVPDDTVLTTDGHRTFVPSISAIPPGHIANPWRMTAEDTQASLDKIRGHLVEFPTQYLSQVNLSTSLLQDAVPTIVFT
ncbi:phospholipase D/nuclease [Hesseltinella vesiculosa]|uniref:Phospholipase n=1 Tax=Hesseltinella vesiculosa TaxID=101127 RepID=A0A1X2GXM8_9FUNG|nr:phospholipase D/nuclease [Hesseltinella vesiculosa]